MARQRRKHLQVQVEGRPGRHSGQQAAQSHLALYLGMDSARATPEAVKIVKLNVDENQQTAAKFGVMSIPTLILFNGGELSKQLVGARPKDELRREFGL